MPSLIVGICRSARHPVPGDFGEERDKCGTGVHDDGGGDQEPSGSPVFRCGHGQQSQDRPGQADRDHQVWMLLKTRTIVR